MSSKKTQSITASVCIPTYNGEGFIEPLLDMVTRQELPGSFEIIVIDSGSTDRTPDIVRQFSSVKLRQIPNSEFGHGKTRNKLANLAKGEFVVYLSQDAVPAHERWLEFMLEPFALNSDVFCVYGKQIPRPHTDATTKREVSSVFNSLGPDHAIMIDRQHSLINKSNKVSALTFFSDVNSAVRRDYLINKLPYRDVRYSEDQLLGKDILEKGYLKAYSPLGSVYHSNEYSVRDSFYRKYDEFMGMFDVLGVLPPHGKLLHLKLMLGDTLRDYLFIFRDKDYSVPEKIKNLFTSPIRNYYRQKASFLIASPKYRDKHKLKFSLENRSKN